MSNNKKPVPTPQDLEKLMKLLEQAPKAPDQAEKDLPVIAPWNVSMKRPGVKRTIAFSLSEDNE